MFLSIFSMTVIIIISMKIQVCKIIIVMMIEYILNTSKTYHGYYLMTEYILATVNQFLFAGTNSRNQDFWKIKYQRLFWTGFRQEKFLVMMLL